METNLANEQIVQQVVCDVISQKPQIIGVSGRKFNGKDTVGDYLVKNYGYKKRS